LPRSTTAATLGQARNDFLADPVVAAIRVK
jgi:hypothetical protein